jgi:hypothetical protein
MGHNKPIITDEHISQINDLINNNPSWNRTVLSKKLCEIWDWKSPTGQIKDISARDLLRALDKKGLICLPVAVKTTRAPGIGADKIKELKHDINPIEAKLKDVAPIQIKIVSSKEDLQLFKSYIHQYHYLGFDRSIGENIKYFAYNKDGDILACLMFGSSAWSCRGRDEYIGWNTVQRRSGLHLVTNNSRFLILPGIKVPHLASHILGSISRRISDDWQVKYGHKIYLLETFVERGRFRGICYRAANWRNVGITSGLGRNSTPDSLRLPDKDILIYPLCKNYKEKLYGYANSIQENGCVNHAGKDEL